jgi:hypothetical protein
MREERIERLVFEIVIREAPLQIREELRQMVSNLLDEETRLLQIISNKRLLITHPFLSTSLQTGFLRD